VFIISIASNSAHLKNLLARLKPDVGETIDGFSVVPIVRPWQHSQHTCCRRFGIGA
jgi:hypothetical protein